MNITADHFNFAVLRDRLVQFLNLVESVPMEVVDALASDSEMAELGIDDAHARQLLIMLMRHVSDIAINRTSSYGTSIKISDILEDAKQTTTGYKVVKL